MLFRTDPFRTFDELSRELFGATRTGFGGMPMDAVRRGEVVEVSFDLPGIDLAELLHMGRLPEAWLAPPAVRELRELVRYRASWSRCAVASRPRSTPCSPRKASGCR
jgi:hypothetical protein